MSVEKLKIKNYFFLNYRGIDGQRQPPLKFKKSAAEEIRKIKNDKYTYEVFSGTEKLPFFYNELYEPFIKNRYGELSLPESMNMNYEDLNSILIRKKAKFFLLKKEDEFVAGFVFTYKKDVIYPVLLGIDSNFNSSNVSSAIYYYLKK